MADPEKANTSLLNAAPLSRMLEEMMLTEQVYLHGVHEFESLACSLSFKTQAEFNLLA